MEIRKVEQTIKELFDKTNEAFIKEFHLDLGITLKYNYEPSENNWYAFASSTDNSITYNIHEVLRTNEPTMLHEFTHLILKRYGMNTSHNLEFAIICYSLQRKFGVKKKLFLRPYDIEQDECYEFIHLSPYEFDGFINSISFNTLDQLVAKAKSLAYIMRSKARQRALRKQEMEYFIETRVEA